MSIQNLRTFRSASDALQRMIATDLASFGDVETFAKRAALLRRSIADERFPADCAWPGVEMADVASLYELTADALGRDLARAA